MTLSVVISAYNEEVKLGRTLDSVSWADEIIVIDNESTDKTAQIAKEKGALVFTQKNLPMLNTNKNYGFSKARSEWILNLDADEEVPQALQKEIKQAIDSNSEVTGYWIPRKNIIFGKWIRHGLWWPDKQLRLFRTGKGVFPCEHIHEYIKVEGEIQSLQEPYIHFNYETISQFLRKLDSLYTENEVLVKQKQGYILHWHDALRFPVSDFVKIYFAQSGYKDGLHGLVLAMFQSFYTFVVFAKLWERQGFKEQLLSLGDVQREFKKSAGEISYWQTTANIEETSHPIKKMVYKLHRKYVSTR